VSTEYLWNDTDEIRTKYSQKCSRSSPTPNEVPGVNLELLCEMALANLVSRYTTSIFENDSYLKYVLRYVGGP